MNPFSHSYIRCHFEGINFITRIATATVPTDILKSDRLVATIKSSLWSEFLSKESAAAIEGNKIYKLAHFLAHPNSFSSIKKIYSYGSIQSNAMAAISSLARLFGAEFAYTVRYADKSALAHPAGNLKYALDNGMRLHIDPRAYERFLEKKYAPAPNEYVLDEGANHAYAMRGFELLSDELRRFFYDYARYSFIFSASGTGLSCYALAHFISSLSINVYTTPAYGDKFYLEKKWAEWQTSLAVSRLPIIIPPPKPYRFGALYRELWELNLRLKKATGISFDLLYDMAAWKSILHHKHLLPDHFLYLHQGGMRGSDTMEVRYKRKYEPRPEALSPG